MEKEDDGALQGEEGRLLVLPFSLLAGEAGAGCVLAAIRAFSTILRPSFLSLFAYLASSSFSSSLPLFSKVDQLLFLN